MTDTRHLSLRGRKWWYVRKIPEALRGDMRLPYTGLAMFRRNLDTSDISIAQQLRVGVGAEFEIEVAMARRRAAGSATARLESQADWWRENWDRIGDYDLVIDQAERVSAELGEDIGKRFYLKATRQAGTDIDKHMEQWLAENSCAPRTAMERRTAIETLARWRGGLDLEKIDRDTVRAYVEDVISPGHAAATINKQLGILASYWHWLMRQGHIPEVPVHWTKFRRKAAREGNDQQERSFTSEEMVTLFTIRPMRPELRDAAMISALLGARLEEVASLRVSHVNLADMTIHLPGTKTAAQRERYLSIAP